MNYETSQTLTHRQFKRRFGVQRATFNRMLKGLSGDRPEASSRGRPHKLSLGNQILVGLEYWREYRTYFHIATDWGVSESTVCRIVHRIETDLMTSGLFRIPGKKELLRGFGQYERVVMDVTETPIERPKRKQKWFYSGKKKQHTLKCQVVIDQASQAIICLHFGQGRTHDFNLFKASGVHFHPETGSLEDSGYQGISRYHSNSYIPQKKPKDGELTDSERDYNRALGSERVCIEHVNRRLKIFKILALRYRNRRRRYGLRCNLIAALYNYERSLAPC
jgi:DDE superfamily endonuclease/Helix-turn-helix of DDE superfamily endonuclease